MRKFKYSILNILIIKNNSNKTINGIKRSGEILKKFKGKEKNSVIDSQRLRTFLMLNNFCLIKPALNSRKKSRLSSSSKIMLLKFDARGAKQLVYPRRNWA